MTIASKIWHGMSESSKQAFNATFKPLCDVLNSEALASGEKHDLTSRLQVKVHATCMGSKLVLLFKVIHPLSVQNWGADHLYLFRAWFQTFQSSLNSTMRKQLEDSISSAVAALAKGKDVNGTPATASKPPKEESSEEESSEEESSEPEPPKPVKVSTAPEALADFGMCHQRGTETETLNTIPCPQSAEKKKRKASEPSSTKKSKKKSKKESTFSEEESD